jgi:ABC transport system ATP-binding/permease protein
VELPDWMTPERCPRYVAAASAWEPGNGAATARVPATISAEQFRQHFSLIGGREIEVGRSPDCAICRVHPQVELKHCVIARSPTGSEYWIADLRTETGTWVNRAPVTIGRINSGDLIQVGPFAFALNGTDGFLVPVAGIPGAELHVENLDVGRLRIERLTIPAGQFIAVTGPSGSGKSTLLKALAGLREFRTKGIVRVDGRLVESDHAWYRSILGYLSQDAIVHGELSPLRALKINHRLRRRAAASDRDVRQVLRELEVPEARWRSPFCELSGGEQKRVRIASELMARPHLLLLDEPASGLDPEREFGLMKLLRALTMQGCTVVMVTHGQSHQKLCHREIRIHEGRIEEERSEPVVARKGRPAEPPPPPRGVRVGSRFTQLRCLLQREAVLSLHRWLGAAPATRRRRTHFARAVGGLKAMVRVLTIPEAFVPILFGVALHLTLPGSAKRELLGFFSILAAIWMGSSLSLLSIAGERTIFEHEHFLYLRIVPYVLAKFLWLGFVSILQTCLFFLVLWFLCTLFAPDATLFFGTGSVLFVLAILGCAGVALGLFISAAAGRNKEAAALLLPLVMIGQIVFSVQVAGDAGFLEMAYSTFHFHRCNVSPAVWAVHWRPDQGGWISQEASRVVQQRYRDKEEWTANHGLARPLNPVERNRILEQVRTEGVQDDEDVRRPSALVILLSYATLSRYGDIALRSFAYDEGAYRNYLGESGPETKCAEQYDYSGWRHSACAAIASIVCAMVLMTIATLRLQTTGLPRLRLLGLGRHPRLQDPDSQAAG